LGFCYNRAFHRLVQSLKVYIWADCDDLCRCIIRPVRMVYEIRAVLEQRTWNSLAYVGRHLMADFLLFRLQALMKQQCTQRVQYCKLAHP
jgi:hypothetical protein